jgi:hypothetical protein
LRAELKSREQANDQGTLEINFVAGMYLTLSAVVLLLRPLPFLPDPVSFLVSIAYGGFALSLLRGSEIARVILVILSILGLLYLPLAATHISELVNYRGMSLCSGVFYANAVYLLTFSKELRVDLIRRSLVPPSAAKEPE